jgi:eukaryotic-like serine/threonine-protein kinase
MVTGRVPYSGSTVEVLLQHVDRSIQPVSPRKLNPEISAGFNALIEKMLAKSREDRYKTPKDLIGGIRGVLMGEPPLDRPEDPAEAPPR